MAMTTCLMAACIWCLTLVARGDGKEPAAPSSEFKPVASVDSLMYGQGAHFSALKDLILYGEGPERAEGMVAEAEILAELANVNTFNAKHDDYRVWAGELRDLALQLAGEAKKGSKVDNDTLRGLFKDMNARCSACHDKYKDD